MSKAFLTERNARIPTLAGLVTLGLTSACFWGGAARARTESSNPGKVIASIPVKNPRLVVVNPATSRVYLTNVLSTGATDLEVYDGVRQRRLATVRIGRDICGLAVHPGVNRIYLTFNPGYHGRYRPGSVAVLDGATNRVITTLTVTSPCAVAVNARANRVYVIDDPPDRANRSTTAPRVLVYDGKTHRRVASIPLEEGSVFHRVAFNVNTNRLYVTDYMRNRVTVISTATNRVIATVTLPDGSYTSDLAVNPVTNRLYVTNTGGDAGYLWVLDGRTNRVLRRVVLGSAGSYVEANVTSNRVYAGQLEVINGVTNTTLGSVPIPSKASDVAVNPRTNRVYAVSGPSSDRGKVVGGRLSVIVECRLGADGNFVCP